MSVIKVNGDPVEWNEGMTVRDILDRMKYTFRLLIVRVDGEIVKKDLWDTYTVPEGADVKVIHLMSGG